MKNISLFILFAISSIANANDNAQPSARHQYTAAQYLKNYALTACLYDAYQAKEVKQDFLDAALGYKELGSLSIEAYNEAGMLAQKFLKKQYSGMHQEKLIAMKCIDFSHSKELDAIIKKYSRK